ncbi:MAG: hypothetical protein ACI9FR_000349 [Cryomorphaceae bacterium]|jgi:hypothetical protein
MNKFISTLLILVGFIFASQSNAATLTSVVDRNQVGLNETITLRVSYDKQIDASKLDLSALAKDFEIFGVRPQSSSSTNIVNGKRTQTAFTSWTAALAPKKSGVLTIPTFAIGSDKSKPISITVGDFQASNGPEPLSVKVSSNYDSVYPGQQFIVEIEIIAQSNVGTLNGPELVVNDAEVEPLEQKNFQRVNNGLAEQVVVLKYAVFAKTSEEVIIPIMTYTGIKGGQRSVFGARGQQILARSQQVSIKVNTGPPNESKPWFPAENVAISSKWSRDLDELKVGEPITRTITINAVAQRASAIPPLASRGDSPEYRSYKDQPQLKDNPSERGFIGTRVESEAIVASSAGELVVPEVRISWFDVGAKRWKEAVLPAESFSVSGVPEASSPRNIALQQNGDLPTTINQPWAAQKNLVWQILTGVFATICLLQLWFITRLRRLKPKAAISKVETASEAANWKSLKKAIKNNRALDIRQALIKWLISAMPAFEASSQPQSLLGIKKTLNSSELNEQIDNLQGALYRNDGDQNSKSINGEKMMSALEPVREQLHQSRLSANTNSSHLAKLYQNDSA